MSKQGLSGYYYVKRVPAVIVDERIALPNAHDRQELRRHILKLRFWPTGCYPDIWPHLVEDLAFRPVEGMANVYQLEIAGPIGPCENLSAVFYVTDVKIDDDLLPRIWVLEVLPGQEISARDMRSIRARIRILQKRFYDAAASEE